MFILLRSLLIQNLSYFYLTMHSEHPQVLSPFCIIWQIATSEHTLSQTYHFLWDLYNLLIDRFLRLLNYVKILEDKFCWSRFLLCIFYLAIFVFVFFLIDNSMNTSTLHMRWTLYVLILNNQKGAHSNYNERTGITKSAKELYSTEHIFIPWTDWLVGCFED